MELYIHIPFCVKKCAYCDFASFPGLGSRMDEYISLLLKEAETEKKDFISPVDTVYIGGGTPSLLPAHLLRRLITGLRELLPMDTVSEFTIESNPGTVTVEWLDTALSLGANRLSMGLQAAQPEILQVLGRIHSPDDVVRSVSMARKAGFSNLSLDLMFGIPGQTENQWRETLSFALGLSPSHISAYGLIPEEGTPMNDALSSGELTLPDPEDERRMYSEAIFLLASAGFKQYEISNFSLPGRECRHNLGYWRQIPYIGLGVSAASMLLQPSGSGLFSVRRTNPASFDAYADMISSGVLSARTVENITPEEARFETMMLALRLCDGISDEDFLALHGVSLESCYGEKLRSLQSRGLAERRETSWRLTGRGMDIQNSVLVELMDG